MRLTHYICGLFLLGLTQCKSASGHEVEGVPPAFSANVHGYGADSPSENERKRRACEATLHEVMQEPALPGAPEFEKRRLDILTRAKALPLLLVDTPQHRESDEELSVAVKSFRKLLSETKYPWDALKRLLPHFEKFPKDGRQTLLRDGYLYADDPEFAYALVNLVNAEHLFGHDQIWVKRGEDLYHAKRKRGAYYFTDGPNKGERVRLLLLDRIGADAEPDTTLLRDIRALRYRLQFNQAQVLHISQTHIVAKLRYGNIAVPTVLRSEGTKLNVECEVMGHSLRQEVSVLREAAERRQRVVQALRETMLEQIDEQLPFDEPRYEYGHQWDGKLRSNWRYAYFHGNDTYAFSGTRYKTFDDQGRPHVPQVCVDFLTDTFERTSGTWWRPKGEQPGREVGKLNYDPMDVLLRAKLRRVPGFLQHAREHESQFDVYDVPRKERVQLGDRERFVQYLVDHSDTFQPGDVVMIRGFTPWDPKEMHYHSFFIYEIDPLSGIPLAVVGNAGRPSVRYWEVEARRTPKREIWHRIRPKTEWLEAIIPDGARISTEPLSLSPRGNAG